MYLMLARESEVSHPRSLRKGGRSWKNRVGKDLSDAICGPVRIELKMKIEKRKTQK
jgi:hypothetical protein